MSFRAVWILMLATWLLAAPPVLCAGFGPGEAAGKSQQGVSDASPSQRRADYKVLFWYRQADPLATFKYQVYDLRKGEFSPSVVSWIKDIGAKYPAYIAFTRDVDLSAEQGKTESLKVGSVIKRELTVAAALSGVILGSPISGGNRPFETLKGVNGIANRQSQSSAPMNDRRFLQAAPPSFPVPLPYPRPHP